MEFLKKHIKDILLIAVYTILAMNVYIVWFHSMWHKHYIDILTAIVILALGITIGAFYIHRIDKEEAEKQEEAKKEPKTE